jgi:hypothetical protein
LEGWIERIIKYRIEEGVQRWRDGGKNIERDRERDRGRDGGRDRRRDRGKDRRRNRRKGLERNGEKDPPTVNTPGGAVTLR